jgi:phosphoribosylglycinamide formyltransferase-1
VKAFVVLISGRGSNLRALLDAPLPGRCAAVISNRADAEGLVLARERGIACRVLDHRAYASREAFDAALAEQIDALAPDLVLLAGFMRILGDDFVRRFEGRLLNIHPSLLPAFPGTRTHAQALAAGVRIHGCTVHFVTPSLDAGPIVIQAAVPVAADDSEPVLAERVLLQEHVIYPLAARWFLEGRLHLAADRRVRIDGDEMPASTLTAPLA